MAKMKCGAVGEMESGPWRDLEGKVGFMKEGNEEKGRLGLTWEEFVKKRFEILKATSRLR